MSNPVEQSQRLTSEQLVGADVFRAELQLKHEQLTQLLAERDLSALLLRRHENLAWATAGQVEARVLIPGETAVAALLFTREGKRYYIAPNNEAPRLADEEFAGLGFEPVLYPWHGAAIDQVVNQLTGKATVGSDAPGDYTAVDLAPLRAALTPGEQTRYCWLSEHAAAVTVEVLEQIEPGITEYEMEALIADGLLAEGILPSVLLMAVDDRIRKYKHAVARGARLERFGMLNLCARKWGLAVSITRYVHFGALPDDLAANFAAAAQVNAALLHATRAGNTSAELFAIAQAAYTDAGFPCEEDLHHQGGATGYGEREWIATPTGAQVIVSNQAFAWNPSIRGGKVEDTVLLTESGEIEILTATPSLPVVETSVRDKVYRSAGVLIRD
jgi:Xaa-Pro dipeptidase